MACTASGRKTAKDKMDCSPHPLGGALRVAFADFSAAPWQGFEKSECYPNNSSLYSPFCRYATSSPDRGKSLLAGSGRRRCCSNPPGSHPQQLLTVFRAERSLLVDIPTGWEPRTEQQPTGLIAHPAAQGRAVRILPVAQKRKAEAQGAWAFLGASGRIRTAGLPGRSRTLYPAELRSHED